MDMEDVRRRAEQSIKSISNDPSINARDKQRLIGDELYELQEQQRECIRQYPGRDD